jgi:hypothetical protein
MASKKWFCQRVREGIKDEDKAGPWYERLGSLAEKSGVPEGDVGKIANIRDDEGNHLATLRVLRTKHCGGK